MKINIKFGKEFDKNRIKNTIVKLDWYKKHGYRPQLPGGIDDKSTDSEILEKVSQEYEEESYNNIAKILLNEFSVFSDKLEQSLVDIFGKNIQTNFNVYLTKYGVGGSYWLPNEIILNVNNKFIVKTFVHEIIHLMIEENVKKYNIKQFEKERTVDLILHSPKFDFLQYNFWQKHYSGVEKYIDTMFEKHFFKSPETFFAEISKVRPIIFLIIGSNGVGKSTIIPLLKQRLANNFHIHDFDERGVPNNADKTWRQLETFHWLELGKTNIESNISTIVCGFMKPNEIVEASGKLGVHPQVCLLDVDEINLKERLLSRYQNDENTKELLRATGKTVNKFIEDNVYISALLRKSSKEYFFHILDTNQISPIQVAESVLRLIAQHGNKTSKN